MGLHRPRLGGAVVRRLPALLCALLLCLAPAAAQTPEPPHVTELSALAVDIAGAVQHPLHLGLAELQLKPRVDVEVSYITGHGEDHARFTGASLWALLTEAALADGQRRRDHLQRSILVTGRDGYAVLFAMGELDPDLEGKPIILAYQRDGATIEPKN